MYIYEQKNYEIGIEDKLISILSSEPKTMIWCESFTQRTNVSRVSSRGCSISACPNVYWEHAEIGTTPHLYAFSEIFVVLWNQYVSDFWGYPHKYTFTVGIYMFD